MGNFVIFRPTHSSWKYPISAKTAKCNVHKVNFNVNDPNSELVLEFMNYFHEFSPNQEEIPQKTNFNTG